MKEKDILLSRLPVEVFAQFTGKAVIPKAGTEIKKDGGMEQFLWLRSTDPAGKIIFPDGKGLAPLWIGGHDLARTERIATIHQVINGFCRKLIFL